MRVLRGVVYMTKSSGPRTEPWGTPQEDRSVTHLTRKGRDDRYDLNQLRTEPWMANQDERRQDVMVSICILGVTVNDQLYTDIAKFAGHLPHRYGNSRAIWDHTVLPATRQR